MKELVQNRILELRELIVYLNNQMIEEPRTANKYKFQAKQAEELLNLNINILQSISNDTQVWH